MNSIGIENSKGVRKKIVFQSLHDNPDSPFGGERFRIFLRISWTISSVDSVPAAGFDMDFTPNHLNTRKPSLAFYL